MNNLLVLGILGFASIVFLSIIPKRSKKPETLTFLLLFITSFAYSQNEAFIMTYDLGLGEPRLTFGTAKYRSASISLGDVDGDQDIDAVVANGRHWPERNFVFYNESGRFTSFAELGSIHSTSYTSELADIDNDGDLDLVEINDKAPHRLYLNDGLGNFAFHSTLAQASSARNVAIGDLDNDQFVDIIICNRNQRNIICFNNGDKTFDCSDLQTDQNATIDIEISDLNKDGLPDLIIANRNKISNQIYLNKGKREFQKLLDFGSGTFESRSIEVADIDNDDIADIITGNINGPNTIYFGDDQLTFARTMTFGAQDEDTYALEVVDFNKDGYMDIVAGNYKKPLAIFINTEGTSFERINPLKDNYKTYDVKVADLDGDGWMDIALANSDDFNLYLLNKFKNIKR